MHDSSEIKDFIVKILNDRKAEDIKTLDLEGVADFTRYMVFASSSSSKSVSSTAEFIKKELKDKTDLDDVRIEGLASGEWVLVDAGDVIVNIFQPHIREIYDLEDMWKKRKKPSN